MHHSLLFLLFGLVLSAKGWELIELPDENPLESDQGKGYDNQCYHDHFALNSGNELASNTTEQAIVVLKHVRRNQYGRELIATLEHKIEQSLVYSLQFEGSDKVADDFQRNLTMSFDGNTVNFAIGKWIENSTFGVEESGWGGCQYARGRGTLDYYDYTEITSFAKLYWLAYSFEVSFRSAKPSGSKYDKSCVPAHTFGDKDRTVNLRHMGAISGSAYPVEYSNQNYTILQGKDLTVELDALICQNGAELKGCQWMTRTLTLWVDKDSQVRMAMALLDENFTNTNYLQWECAYVYYNDDGAMEITFASYENTGSFTKIFASVRPEAC